MVKTKAPRKSRVKRKVTKKVKKVKKPKVVKKVSPKKNFHLKPRSYYNVKEDATLLKALSKKKAQTVGKIVEEYSRTFQRTKNSVRDRIRRYLDLLSSSDKKKIINYAKKHPYCYA